MVLRLIVAGFLIVQSSCVGISTVTGKKQIELSGNIGDEIGESGNNLPGITTADVVRHWGQPKSKTTVDEHEVWRYRSGKLSWRGMEVWAIISIPVLVPIGHKKVTLEFTKGILTKYTIDNARIRYTGFFITNGTSRVWQLNQEEITGGCKGFWGCY